jgi:ribosomal-protein-alanine N-acetyltransferase
MQTIETSRLMIRVDTYEDYIGAYATKDDVTLKAMFGIQTHADLEVQKGKVAGGLITYRTSLRFFHMILKETEEVVGSFAYHNWFPMHQRSEIGYDIKTEGHKNKGYMKEAFPFLLSHGFQEMGLYRMEAFIDPDNVPSRKLVEAAGFESEGLLKDRYRYNEAFTDAIVYCLFAKDYA